MNSDIKIIIAILAVLVWIASWIVRRKKREAGVILSWTATALALVAVLLVWLA